MRTVGMILPPEKQKYLCPVCGKEWASEKKLEEHLAKEHPEEK